jgi:glycosyltransferase involved in cell wall biosynthesis
VASAIEVARADYAALPALLRAADVLLNPRTGCDGIPQKLLNYMAAGRPIVSFAGSAKGLVHERSGLIAPDGDVPAFARAVLRVLGDPALGRALGARAQEQARTDHSWQRAAARVEQVYEQLRR